jgi:BirA family biotin operon repressor/biotin-[acetyl-CoA-carboxylase] ligase
MDTRILELDTADSTQDVARAEFDGVPTLVVAARQTRGRGRSGSDWDNAPRALACSLAFVCPWRSERYPLLPLVAALAVTDLWPDVKIKWPNDIFLDDRKLGGILAEASDALTVIGLGANLWWPDAPADRGARFADDPGHESLLPLAYSWSGHLMDRIGRGPKLWGHDEYAERSWLLGHHVTWEPDGRGKAVAIDTDGALLVESDGVQRRIVSGAVRRVRRDPQA